jgi:S1-C subfamily serine protease
MQEGFLMSSTLAALSDDLAGAVERTAPFVVAVNGHGRIPSSGVVWRAGVVVTAEHSLKSDDDLSVVLADGRKAAATLAGRDPGTDLAVLKVAEADAAPAIAPAGSVKTGNLALAVARSPELGANATMGVISAVGPPWSTWRGGRLDQYIRLDVSLYPGSSGAAVVDTAGRLVGIATSALSRAAGVAIPASTVERVAAELLSKGRIPRGYLGLGLQPVGLPEHLITKLKLQADAGLIVLTAEPGGPAGRAGVLVGDILVALDGKPVEDLQNLHAALAGDTVGKTVKAAIVRGGELNETPIVVGERPGRP